MEEDYLDRFFHQVYEIIHSGRKYIAIEGFPQGDHTLLFDKLPKYLEDEIITQSIDRKDLFYLTIRPSQPFDKRDFDEWRMSFIEVASVSNHVKRKSFTSGVLDVVGKTSRPANALTDALDKIILRRKEPSIGGLSEMETEIIEKLNYLAKRATLVILCESVGNWSESSLNLLNKLLSEPLCNTRFLENVFFLAFDTPLVGGKLWEPHAHIKDRDRPSPFTSKASSMSKEPQIFWDLATLVSLPKQDRTMVRDITARLHKEVKISDSEIDAVLEFACHDIEKLDRVCSALQSGFVLDGKNSEYQALLHELLTSRLAACDIQQQDVERILKYASLLGLTFSKKELYNLANMSDETFNQIISQAKIAKVFDECTGGLFYDTKFAQRFVYNLIKEGVSPADRETCIAVEKLLAKHHSGAYEQRAELLLKADECKQAADYYLLSTMRKAWRRDSHKDALSLFNTVAECSLSQKDHEARVLYLKGMLRAYELHHAHRYDEARRAAFSIDANLLPSFLNVEKALFLSLCSAKTVDSEHRAQAVEDLQKALEIMEMGEKEIEVWERASIQLMIMRVHLGEIAEAKKLEKSIFASLQSRRDSDEEAQKMLYELDRVSVAYEDLTTARQRVSNAVLFFRIENEFDLDKPISSYYRALVNLAAKQVICGRYNEAVVTVEEAVNLIKSFEGFDFPRKEILVNTGIILGVLNESLKPQQAIEMYEKIDTLYDGAAENLFFVSNKAIMHALNNDFASAFSILEEEAKKHAVHSDQEKIYRYRYKANCAAFLQLQGKHEEALSYISELSDADVGGTDALIERGRLARLKKAIACNEGIRSGWTWLKQFERCNDSLYEDEPYLYQYYGLGFVFTTCSDWDL